MKITPLIDHQTKPHFKILNNIRIHIIKDYFAFLFDHVLGGGYSKYFDDSFDTLSMGMSDDYPIALEYDTTEVRIGSTIFGSRTL